MRILFLLSGFVFLVLGFFSKCIPAIDQSSLGLIFLGFIFVVDQLCVQFKRPSLIKDFRLFVALFLFSMSFWTLFSVINVKWQLWANQFVIVGAWNFFFYWAYHGALFPAFFVTKNLIHRKAIYQSKPVSFYWMVFALFCFLLGFVHLTFYPLFFIAPFFFFDYLNAKENRPSILYQWKLGKLQSSLVIGICGLVLGVLYEAINFYYGPFWEYAFPYGFGPKLFSMRLSGYIGYFVFGFDLYASAIFLLSLVSNKKLLH